MGPQLTTPRAGEASFSPFLLPLRLLLALLLVAGAAAVASSELKPFRLACEASRQNGTLLPDALEMACTELQGSAAADTIAGDALVTGHVEEGRTQGKAVAPGNTSLWWEVLNSQRCSFACTFASTSISCQRFPPGFDTILGVPSSECIAALASSSKHITELEVQTEPWEPGPSSAFIDALKKQYPLVTTLRLSTPVTAQTVSDISEVWMTQLGTIVISNSDLPHALAEWTLTPLSNVTALNLTFNAIQDVPAPYLASAPQLREVSLANNAISALDASVFASNRNLHILDLSDNLLTNIGDGTFGTLSQLQYLRLSRNRLTVLTKGVMMGLVALQELWLDFNDITSVQPGALDAMTSLLTLDLSYNLITSIPSGLLARMSNLEILRLSRNKISTLPEGMLSSQSRLRRLTVDELYDLRSLNPSLLSQATSLESFNANHGSIRQLPQGLFDNQGVIFAIAVRNNSLTQVSASLFKNTVALRAIDMGLNKFTRFEEGMFDNCPELRVVDLSGVNLRELPSTAFSLNPELMRIDLSDNGLSSLPPNLFSSHPDLQYISIANNAFVGDVTTYLQQSLVDGRVGTLNVSNNPNLTVVPSALLSGLSVLDVSHTQM